MTFFKTALLATSAFAAFTGVALAADPILPPPAAMPVYEAPLPAGNAWEGAYLGIYGGAGFVDDEIIADDAETFYGLGVTAGFNFALTDSVIAGVEVQAGYYDWNDDFEDVNGFESYALGRLGLAVTDAVLVYGVAGVGYVENVDGVYAFGGGVEVALTESLSLKGEVLRVHGWDDGFGIAGEDPFRETRATVGLNFRF